jgi:hypothetical protein
LHKAKRDTNHPGLHSTPLIGHHSSKSGLRYVDDEPESNGGRGNFLIACLNLKRLDLCPGTQSNEGEGYYGGASLIFD